MAVSEQRIFAEIKEIRVPELFRSDTNDKFAAEIDVVNKSEFSHSAQVVFRGYIRQKELLLYEFFHEQVWVLISPNENTTKHVSVDVWLPRFPPTTQINKELNVEYSVKATIDPWYKNNFLEKIFVVKRKLYLKMPHAATHPKKILVNQCVGHEGWGHRIPDAGHPMLTHPVRTTLAKKEFQVKDNEKDNMCELELPKKLRISIPMSLWNVLSNNYSLLVQIKTAAHSRPVDIVCPIIITSEAIDGVSKKKQMEKRLHERALDKDDDSDDDDDDDSGVDEDPAYDREYSIDLVKIAIKTEKGGSLKDAYAQVFFEVNSTQPRPLKNLRLMLVGEIRANATWYEFLRFKAIIGCGPNTMFSPGPHSVKVSLPFKDSQYDTNILAPSLGDDIRYVCRSSMESWRKNVVHLERDIPVDRFVDTWAKEEFKNPHKEIMGVNEIFMRQKCFQRGKFAFVKLTGDVRKVRLELVQQRRLRIPELRKDESYCYEKCVAVYDGSEDKLNWPEEWFLYIPKNIPPSIEISYWNILVLSYSLVVVNTLSDGHTHRYAIPIWIGCTDDNLELPVRTPKTDVEMVDVFDELPEFEVIQPEETLIQPYWVERYNSHTYGYDI